MLRDLQDGFRTAVLSGDDTAATRFIATGAGHRIAVHRINTQVSLADTLAAAFPAVQVALGADAFRALAYRAIAQQPPSAPQLLSYGDHLPGLIAAAANPAWPPYLADLARLEWARMACYFAADTPALDPGALAAVAPEDLAAIRFLPHPAVRLVASPSPILGLWRWLIGDGNELAAGSGPVTVLVMRQGDGVAFHELEGGNAHFTERLFAGQPLGEAMTAAADVDPHFDLQAALAEHLARGSFHGVTLDPASARPRQGKGLPS